MRKAEKIPHIHSSQVSQSGFNAKVNVLTFGKLQDNFFFVLFSTFSVLYNDYNIRLKKKKKSSGLVLSVSKEPRTGSHNRETSIES